MNEQTNKTSLTDFTKEQIEQAKTELINILSEFLDLEDIRLTQEQILSYLMRKQARGTV